MFLLISPDQRAAGNVILLKKKKKRKALQLCTSCRESDLTRIQPSQWQIQGAHRPGAPQGSRFFCFDIQILWKVDTSGNGSTLWYWRPLREILDQPLLRPPPTVVKLYVSVSTVLTTKLPKNSGAYEIRILLLAIVTKLEQQNSAIFRGRKCLIDGYLGNASHILDRGQQMDPHREEY